MSAHHDFAAALLRPASPCPAGLKTWNGSDPGQRFGIHRNNIMVSLVDALADSYPVIQALVGQSFFRAMAAEFVRLAPPRSPVLAGYGADFPEFIAGFPPAAALTYLADMARLEWLRVESWHAADATALAQADLLALLADEARLCSTRFALHPALRVICSAHPVVSLWAAHQDDDPDAALAAIDMLSPEAALLLRPGLGVEITPIETKAVNFIAQLQAGETFAQAVACCGRFDLPATLGLMIRGGALVGILPNLEPS